MKIKAPIKFKSNPKVFFKADLYPNCSLSQYGFRLLMVMSAILMIGVTLMGAWPVMAFCGMELLLLYIMFRSNYRSARKFESISLDTDSFVIRRSDPTGRRACWRLEPTWLQVHMDNPPESHSQLTIANRGIKLTVGKFLTPSEKLELARALRKALHIRNTSPRF